MSSTKKLAEFPNVEAKLQKPTKKSAFERHKEELEAKRQREAAETEAALKDFVKSFDRDGDGNTRDNRTNARRYDRGPSSFGGPAPSYGGATGRRHFGMPSNSQGMKSGPGSLGPPPTGFGKKRTFDGFSGRADRDRDIDRDRDRDHHHDHERDEGRGRIGLDGPEPSSRPLAKIFDTSDDEDAAAATDRAEEKALARPTLRLSSLPPNTSPAVIKALIPPNLAVESVKILPPAGPGGTERKSIAAIVALSPETAATDIDAAVSALQNRYLGFGFYLSLHRHLSSAAISGSLANVQSASSSSQPFGAKPVAHPHNKNSHHQDRGRHGRGFAPPSSYGASSGGPGNRAGILHVPVQPLRDIKKLRMIHMVLEAMLQHGPEFEALLMSRPDVQRDEKWAWIWDARSEGGVWYRYRLWQVITGSKPRRGQAKYTPLFEGSSAWKLPEQPLPYEYTTGLDEFVSDSEYNSSDDDDFDDEPHRQGEAGTAGNDQDDSVLSPLEKAKLVHLLARLPTTLTKLRKGDIARVATFAITHASRGADEIVDLIVSNAERPFAYTLANPDRRVDARTRRALQDGDSRASSPGQEEKQMPDAQQQPQDQSAARLIGLYVISDILSSSATSGIRHAWRYRQHFEAALRGRRTFEALGLVPEKLKWGRLRVEKWKRSVGVILSQWEVGCVFPAETQALFVQSFENPPSQKKEGEAAVAVVAEEEHKADDAPKKRRWKTVDAVAVKTEEPADGTSGATSEAPPHLAKAAEAEGGPVDEPDLEYTDDEDLDLEFLDEEDIDGEPLIDGGMAGLSMDEQEDTDMRSGASAAATATAPAPVPTPSSSPDPPKAAGEPIKGFQISAPTTGTPKKRTRMRAVDMFAESDSEKD